MRIHTSLSYGDMMGLAHKSGAPISYEVMSSSSSRTHAHAYEVRLTGSGGRNNTGMYGAGDYCGATWDEWGAFFGALYDADPDARCGGSVRQPIYADAEDYHFQTGDRFRRRFKAGHTTLPTYLPADTHPRHRWEYEGAWGDHGMAGYHCAKDGCSATRPSHEQIQARRAA